MCWIKWVDELREGRVLDMWVDQVREGHVLDHVGSSGHAGR